MVIRLAFLLLIGLQVKVEDNSRDSKSSFRMADVKGNLRQAAQVARLLFLGRDLEHKGAESALLKLSFQKEKSLATGTVSRTLGQPDRTHLKSSPEGEKFFPMPRMRKQCPGVRESNDNQ